MRAHAIRLSPLLALLATAIAPATAQDMTDVQIRVNPIAKNIYMLTGHGGNIGLCVGDSGAFLIDDQYAPLTDKILAAIKTVTDKPVKFVVNTHWHGDHTGGNEHLGNAGVIIVAHENVRKRLSTEQFIEAFSQKTPPAPQAALPIITFADSITFHWNDETIHVYHVPPAHTDGDAIIYFEKANVLHTGDTFFNGFYPFIDTSTGGSIDGMIGAVDIELKLINDDTKLIPGHGPVGTVKELRDYRAMLVTARDAIRKSIDAGKTRKEVITANPTAELDEGWGHGFIKPDMWVGIVYDSLKK